MAIDDSHISWCTEYIGNQSTSVRVPLQAMTHHPEFRRHKCGSSGLSSGPSLLLTNIAFCLTSCGLVAFFVGLCKQPLILGYLLGGAARRNTRIHIITFNARCKRSQCGRCFRVSTAIIRLRGRKATLNQEQAAILRCEVQHSWIERKVMNSQQHTGRRLHGERWRSLPLPRAQLLVASATGKLRLWLARKWA